MKVSEIKLIQQELAVARLYNAKIDGKRGSKTNTAIQKALSARKNELPDKWETWSSKRKAVGYLQLLCQDNNIDPGPIDGFYGPNTETAARYLITFKNTGIMPRAFGDIIPIHANPHQFPLEREENLNEFYAKPCKGKLVKVRCPWELRLDWDLATTTRTISIHEKLKDSLEKILQAVFDHYGLEGIKKHGLDRYGGSFNCRKKRGSTSSWSTHAWGIAIDWFPSRNKLKWDSHKASLAHPDLDFWWETWEKEGWVSLGRKENRDWMHVQAAKR